ncbi:hypothetical protein BsWGS_20125 [Bradybaena similaris]
MKWSVVCLFMTCVVLRACAVLDQPCDQAQSSCDVGECCNYVGRTAGAGSFKGVCKANLKLGDECSPGTTVEGQCSCSHGMSCVSADAGKTSKCFYLPH